MPRSSIFRRNKKKVEEKKVEDKTTLDINDAAYSDINADSFTMDVDESTFTYEAQPDLKKPGLKKERKPRKKRTTKKQKEAFAKLEEEEKAIVIAEEPKKDDIMAKLKAMEVSRNVVIAPIKEELIQKPIIIKSKSLDKSSTDRMIMINKSYNIKFNLIEQTSSLSAITFCNVGLNKDLFRLQVDKRSRSIRIEQYAHNQWCRITSVKSKFDDVKITVKFLNDCTVPVQIFGSSQNVVTRIERKMINKCHWDIVGLTIV